MCYIHGFKQRNLKSALYPFIIKTRKMSWSKGYDPEISSQNILAKIDYLWKMSAAATINSTHVESNFLGSNPLLAPFPSLQCLSFAHTAAYVLYNLLWIKPEKWWGGRDCVAVRLCWTSDFVGALCAVDKKSSFMHRTCWRGTLHSLMWAHRRLPHSRCTKEQRLFVFFCSLQFFVVRIKKFHSFGVLVPSLPFLSE